MITPEIAAFVVKEYLLPMFENDGKRIKNRKGGMYNKSKGNLTAHSEQRGEIDLFNKDYKKI